MSDDGAKVPKIPQDLITQVSRDNEYIDDYSGGISARREPGEEPDLPEYDDDEEGGSSSGGGGGGFLSKLFCCLKSESSTKAKRSGSIPVNTEVQEYLLPPLYPIHKGRKCLVLDLDETLVHSSFRPIPNADFIIPVEIDDTIHQVYVSKRPGVDEFMKAMGQYYEIVVFTASLSKYADPVLDLLDIHKVVTHRLFRDACCHNRGNYVKDLSRLGRVLNHTIIIDNSPASFMFHPDHAIAIDSWFDDMEDTELLQLIPFLTELSKVDDVRDNLRKWAQSKQWKG